MAKGGGRSFLVAAVLLWGGSGTVLAPVNTKKCVFPNPPPPFQARTPDPFELGPRLGAGTPPPLLHLLRSSLSMRG